MELMEKKTKNMVKEGSSGWQIKALMVASIWFKLHDIVSLTRFVLVEVKWQKLIGPHV